MYTIRDLIGSLEGFAAEYGDDLQVRVALQGLRTPQEFPLYDVDVVEIDGKTDEPWEIPRHMCYLVPESIGNGLAFEARRVFRS